MKKLPLLMALLLTAGFCLWQLALAPAPPEKGYARLTLQRQADRLKLLTGAGEPDESRQELLPGEKIDINNADAPTLKRLPGIGDKLSRAIIEYRESIGGFEHIRQLMEIEGIDEELFGRIWPWLEVKEVKE